MIKTIGLLLLLFAMVMACREHATTVFAEATPPVAPKKPHAFQEYGKERQDPYFWMSDPDDPAVIAHLQAENAYCDSVLSPLKGLRNTLFREMVEREEAVYQTVPVWKNGYFYYEKYEPQQEYPVFCRKKGNMQSPEEMLLNVPAMAKGFATFRLYTYAVSPNNRHLAFLLDTAGDRRNRLFIKDLQTGELLPDRISNAADESLAWAGDSKTLFYVSNDHTVRGYQLRRHQLGTPTHRDPVLFTERDSTFELHVESSQSRRFILAYSWNTQATEYRFLEAARPESKWQLIQPRQSDVIYSADHFEGETFHLLTNHQATNFKLVTAPVASPGMAFWHDLIPHRDSVLVENYQVLKDYIILQEKINGLTQIEVIHRGDQSRHIVDFGEPDYVGELLEDTDVWDTNLIRLGFSSLKTPYSTYRYDLQTRQKQLLRRTNAGPYDPTRYETRRVWATASDGAKVPISIVYRKDRWKQDGKHPFYLYAYGSYGSNSDPYFDQEVISLLDRGFAYGIAHIRGGQEMGRDWYEKSRVLTKKNTFNDYIDCAEFLVRERYASSDGLFANGLSAGGMLMGVVINRRPDLFRGVIAEVPWMDVITDMFNDDLPLTTLEYTEWGNPYQREEYEYMLSWSPYDNIRPAVFPGILATGGLYDTQVAYYSPAKWVARIREANRGNQPVLFTCNMQAGHAGASGRFDRFQLPALKYAWVLGMMGMN